jgi:hypothetical protein
MAATRVQNGSYSGTKNGSSSNRCGSDDASQHRISSPRVGNIGDNDGLEIYRSLPFGSIVWILRRMVEKRHLYCEGIDGTGVNFERRQQDAREIQNERLIHERGTWLNWLQMVSGNKWHLALMPANNTNKQKKKSNIVVGTYLSSLCTFAYEARSFGKWSFGKWARCRMATSTPRAQGKPTRARNAEPKIDQT